MTRRGLLAPLFATLVGGSARAESAGAAFNVSDSEAPGAEPAHVVLEGPDTGALVLCFGGWPGASASNTPLRQALRSQNFAVGVVTFPTASSMPDVDFSSDEAANRTFALADSRTRARATTVSRLLDRVARSSRGGPRPIATLGHSFGGALAAECAAHDARVQAAVNLDGWHFGGAAQTGVPCPYLLVSDDAPVPTIAEAATGGAERRFTRADYERSRAHMRRHEGMYVTIGGASHDDLGEPPPGLLGAAATRRRRVSEALDVMVPAFLVAALRGGPVFPGDLARRFPALRIERLGSAGSAPAQ